MKKHVIITSIDHRYGEFFIEHWLPSLQTNVLLKNIDVIVIDYGLTTRQKGALIKNGVKQHAGHKKGHVVFSRFIDAGIILDKTSYDQVLFVDGGDIIFQSDISELFKQNASAFRIVPQDMEVLFHEIFIPGNFSSKHIDTIYKFLKNKPVLNAGFVLGPRLKFIELCKNIQRLIINTNAYGPDQVALNYLLHKERLVLLDKKYNFMLDSVREGFMLKDGVFYLKNGDIIPVVHNSGNISFWRPIDHFGYGKRYNTIKYPMYQIKKFIFHLLEIVKKQF